MRSVPSRRLLLAGLVAPPALLLWSFALPAADDCVLQTNLVSNVEGSAANVDAELRNPWGVAFVPGAVVYWVANNESGTSTAYDGSGTRQETVITIPPAVGEGLGSPTGVVTNFTQDFLELGAVPAQLLFVTEDGLVVAWHPSIDGSTGRVVADRSSAGANYKGCAIGNDGVANFLYAADFHNGRVDVFDKNFVLATSPGGFQDKTIPKGFAPFNVQNVGGALYVTYAKQDAEREDEVVGRNQGIVNVFDANGFRLRRFVTRARMNAPWAVTLVPAGFGSYSRRLLIGNFGDGTMQTFDLERGRYKGPLRGMNGKAISIEGLWGIAAGTVSPPNEILWFAAGPNDEQDGLYGKLAPSNCTVTVR